MKKIYVFLILALCVSCRVQTVEHTVSREQNHRTHSAQTVDQHESDRRLTTDDRHYQSVFVYDSISVTDGVYHYRERSCERVDTLLRVDTIRLTDSVLRYDTVLCTDSVLRVDTVYLSTPDSRSVSPPQSRFLAALRTIWQVIEGCLAGIGLLAIVRVSLKLV